MMKKRSPNSLPLFRDGMSLVEIMIAMTIFGIVAAGLLTSITQNYRAAQSNICESTALTIATGYLEQIKAMSYNELLMSVGSPSLPVKTKIDQGTDDPLYIGQRIKKSVTLNVDGEDKPSQTLDMWFTLTIDDLNTKSDPLNALEIKIIYEWQEPGMSTIRADNVRFVRSWVETY